MLSSFWGLAALVADTPARGAPGSSIVLGIIVLGISNFLPPSISTLSLVQPGASTSSVNTIFAGLIFSGSILAVSIFAGSALDVSVACAATRGMLLAYPNSMYPTSSTNDTAASVIAPVASW